MLKSPDGLAVAQDLVRKADVLIENFGPGTMDRLGLGWDAVHALNPRLIYCALKGFLPGPYEHRPSLDEIAQYMTGLAYMTGPPGQPLRAGASVIDIMGGVMGAVAILAALRQRDKDGQGRNITSALYESLGLPGRPAHGGRGRHRHTVAADAGAQRRVGYLRDIPDAEWREAVHRHHLRQSLAIILREVRSSGPAGGRPLHHQRRPGENRPALREIVAAIVAGYPIADLERIMDEANIPFSPVRTPSDLFDDPQLNAFGRALRGADAERQCRQFAGTAVLHR